VTFDGAKQVLDAVDNMRFLEELLQLQGIKKALSYWIDNSLFKPTTNTMKYG
jgi:hypothetical protein